MGQSPGVTMTEETKDMVLLVALVGVGITARSDAGRSDEVFELVHGLGL
jgi:hypothetical protein